MTVEETAAGASRALATAQALAAQLIADHIAEQPPARQTKDAVNELAVLLGLGRGEVWAMYYFAADYEHITGRQWEQLGDAPVYPRIIGWIIYRCDRAGLGAERTRKLVEAYEAQQWTERQMRLFTSQPRPRGNITAEEYMTRRDRVIQRGIPDPDRLVALDETTRGELALDLRKTAAFVAANQGGE